jgi:hypothetical protein
MCQAYMCKIWLLHLSQIVSPFSLRFGAERVHVSEWSTKLVINPKETEGSSTIGRLGKGSKEGCSIISMWHSLGAHFCTFPSSHCAGALFSFAQQGHVGLLGLGIRCPIPLSTFQTRAGQQLQCSETGGRACESAWAEKQTNQGLLLLLLRPCLDAKFFSKFYYAKRRFPITSKCRHMHGVPNVDEIKN